MNDKIQYYETMLYLTRAIDRNEMNERTTRLIEIH